MSWLLALHSSSVVLGVGLQRLDDPQPPIWREFDLGRSLSNQLFDCVEQVLPASHWSDLARLAVATGPGGFTGTRLTVVMARTLAQQLALPLDGVSSFLLVARRLELQQPTWLLQELPRRGVVAGLYAPQPDLPGGMAQLESPRLFRDPAEIPAGPRCPAAVQLPDDVEQLLAISGARHRSPTPGAPWQLVLPIYPTSPVDG